MESAQRVRKSTTEKRNEIIDRIAVENIKQYQYKPDKMIRDRLNLLDKEKDIEQILELNMSILAMTGIVLTAFVNRKWLLLPAVVTAFFMQHAIQGWCPPLPIFRALKYRTRREIENERTALKALRGDFNVKTPDQAYKAAWA